MIALLTSLALAKSWCAQPLIAHEWGVQVIRADGQPAKGADLPAWFEHNGIDPQVGTAVRDLPPDSGIRDLPVVQLFAAPGSRDIPFAMEVGFTDGSASAWWPPVDVLNPASRAHSLAARAARDDLLEMRAKRDPYNPLGTVLPPDPTRQIVWESLSASTTAPATTRQTDVAWVDALRKMPDALWITHGSDTERFIFYEGSSPPTSALTIERGPTWSAARPHYLLRNNSNDTVYDVLIVANGKAWSSPAIPAQTTAGFLLDQPLDAAAVQADWKSRWSEAPPADGIPAYNAECVMMRDPAIPFEVADGYRLYPGEVDALMSVWSGRLTASTGVHLVYREDTEALDAAMPASLYTDMFHDIEWNRLGVTLVEGLELP